MPAADLQDLEAKLGHFFHDRNLLVRALTHRSFAFGQKSEDPTTLDNERLEFLGDSILGFIISECLVLRHHGWPEGRLSKVKAHLVSATHLHRVAQKLGLGPFLQLGRSEEMSGGRQKKMLLANAVEAIIAALHIDGGLDSARRFVIDYVLGGSNVEELLEAQETNYKSRSALKRFTSRSLTTSSWKRLAPDTPKRFWSRRASAPPTVVQVPGLRKNPLPRTRRRLFSKIWMRISKVAPPDDVM
jgi:dsRNA-specific ribonuclease